jgi:hypothetical protein
MQQQVMRLGRRIGIAIAGGAVIAAGVAGLALPVLPGMFLIVLGLGILSLEFERPRIWLARLKARGVKLKDHILHKRPESGGD